MSDPAPGGAPADPIRDWPTDLHVHIQPWEMMRPEARRVIQEGRADGALIKACMADPNALLAWLDRERLGRVALINYVAPAVMGFTAEVNAWAARYRNACGGRVIAFGGVHPPACADVEGEMSYLLDELELDGIKIHPPHQELAPDAYRTGACPALRDVYEACSERGVPVMFHTGTSIFPGARSRLGDAMALDDVAVDFPKLKIILAHAGRPLWTDEAFFLVRRHPEAWLDLSGIPPKSLLAALPRLEEISDRCLWGTDWPSPGVKSARANLDAFLALPISDAAKTRITRDNALRLFPPRAR
ncbi:MAG TPA: amidohydrolase family protein [Planctomycetota bacterium]|nr:amidohydrolase family protein [Planctomycetota bacterium]